MKPIFLLSLLLLTLTSSAQIIKDPSVESKFLEAFKKYSNSEKVIEVQEGIPILGFTVITENKVDTLNKDKLLIRHDATLISLELDTVTGEFIEREYVIVPEEEEEVLFCYAILSNDSLSVFVTTLFADPILHLITDKILTEYRESTADFRYKLNLQDTTFLNELNIPAKSRFLVSDNIFSVGKTIYAEVEIITDPYFEKYWDGVQVMKLQRRMKYLMKFTIADPKDLPED